MALLISSAPYSVCQQINLSGRVAGPGNKPVIQAKIIAKKAGIKVLSDSSGFFTLFCNKQDRIIIRADGFFTEKVLAEKADSFLYVLMTPSGDAQNETITMDILGDVPKSDLSYAVDQISDNGDFSQFHNIFELFEGRLTGVRVMYSDTTRVVIRGVGALYDCYASFVVNGMYQEDISYIAPAEVATITVLKDASVAMYGVRGGCGMIIITTKDAAYRKE